MSNLAYQVTGFAYQGDGLFAYQGSTDVPGPSVYYQGDGKKRKKRKNETNELFDNIEQSLRETIYGHKPSSSKTSTTIGTAAAAVNVDIEHGIERALKQLTETAVGYDDLSERVATIRREIAAFEDKRRNDENEDDAFFMG